MLLEDDDDGDGGDGGGNDDDRGVQLPTSWKAGSRSLLLDAQKTEWPVGEVSAPLVLCIGMTTHLIQA